MCFSTCVLNVNIADFANQHPCVSAHALHIYTYIFIYLFIFIYIYIYLVIYIYIYIPSFIHSYLCPLTPYVYIYIYTLTPHETYHYTLTPHAAHVLQHMCFRTLSLSPHSPGMQHVLHHMCFRTLCIPSLPMQHMCFSTCASVQHILYMCMLCAANMCFSTELLKL
jgi:hypothetical protein